MSVGNVLVGGGTGFIGTHLCKALRNKGYGVTIISRMPGPQRMSWTDLESEGLPGNTSAVVNLAGQNVMDFTRRWTAGFKQNVYNSRINTTASLAKAIDKANAKPKVFVTMSGVGAYKPDPKKEYNEQTPIEKFDFFSELCLHWEKAAEINTESKKDCQVTTIRSGVVLGRDGGMIKNLYLPFSLGLGGPIGTGEQYLPWIHIDDIVGLIMFAVESQKISGILNGVAPEPATNKQFTEAFAQALNRPALIPTPAFVMNILLNPERAKMVIEGQKVLPKRPLQMGYKYKFPTIVEACKALVKKG